MRKSWVKLILSAICLALFIFMAVGSSPEELQEELDDIAKSLEDNVVQPGADEADQYTLGYYAKRTDAPSAEGGGQVSAEPYVADGIYAKGSVVTMIQQADKDFDFSHWEIWKKVGGEMKMVQSSTDSSVTVTIDAETSIDAFFKPKG